MDECLDGQTVLMAVADGDVSVSALLSSLLSSERRRWRGRSSNASASLSPEGVLGPGGGRTHEQMESTKGRLAFYEAGNAT